MSSSEHSTESENGSFLQGTSRGRRGRSRSGRRGARTGRGRTRSRSAGRSRSQTASRERFSGESEVADLLAARDEKMKSEIAVMDTEALRRLCLEMVSAHPGLVFDILKPAARQPGGYHPPPGTNLPDWCVCLKCREMPSEAERICCGKDNCITLLPNFQLLVLDEEVLALGRTFRRDVLVYDDEGNRNKANRHQAYRQYIMWQHGKLGAGVRLVVPSCSVWAIRDKYPDPFGKYTGFKASRFA